MGEVRHIGDWRDGARYGRPPPRQQARPKLPRWLPALALPLVAYTGFLAFQHATAEQVAARRFELCSGGVRVNCVVDGDTFYLDGRKVRVADIDAPETHPSRCVTEEQLGSRATLRLQALLNGGPFELRRGRDDRDQYGRLLRTVVRDGQSLGDVLVDEGIARTWIGHREPWC